MRFLKLSLLLLAFHVHANEGAAKAEGGGSGIEPVPKDQREYTEKNSKLNSLISRITESEKQFGELVHRKSEAKSTTEKQTIIHEMVELTNQRNKDVDTYNKLKAELELRYPNQGEHLNRRYQTQTKRSVEELEGVAGLDELLTHTKKIVEKKYAPLLEDDPKSRTPSRSVSGKISHPPGVEPDEPKRLRLEK